MKPINFKSITYHSLTKCIAALLCACAILTGIGSAIIMLAVGEEHPISSENLYEGLRDNVLSNYFAMLLSNIPSAAWKTYQSESSDDSIQKEATDYNEFYDDLTGSKNISYAVVYTGHKHISEVRLGKKATLLYASKNYEPDLTEDEYWEGLLYDNESYFNFDTNTLTSCFSSHVNTYAEDMWLQQDGSQDEQENKLTTVYVVYHFNHDTPILGDDYNHANDFNDYFGKKLDTALVAAYALASLSWWVYQNATALILCCFFACLFLMIYLSFSAGHRMGTKEITIRKTDKIWLEPGLMMVFSIEYVLAALLGTCIYSGSVWDIVPMGLLLSYIALLILSMSLLCIYTWMSIAVRFKAGIMFRQTAIYVLGKWLYQFGKNFLKLLLWPFMNAEKQLPLVLKAAIACICISFMQALFIFWCFWGIQEPDIFVFFFLIYKLTEILVILYMALHTAKLRDGIRRLSEGDYSTQIDTSHMYLGMKSTAEDLGKIRSGLSLAVAEQMKSERMKTELITNVSHDIKTPLTSIINYVDLLEKENIENPKAKEYMDVLHRQSQRLKKLIEDLIEASKASSGNLELSATSCDTGVIVSQLIGEYEEKAQSAGLEIVIKQPETPVTILADGRYLWRVFDNLFSNICKYSLPHTRAYIDVETDGNCLSITFKNISKAPLNISTDELMERFVRGDESRHTEGNGLGLSIAKNLTEHMGGTFHLIIDGDLFKAVIIFPLEVSL